MTNFPDPIPLPDHVPKYRHNRRNQVLQAAKWGISLRLFVIAFEFIGFYLFDSSALFVDALASGIDVICSLMLILCIRLAARPPDDDHPFGYGRYEPLAGMQLGVFMILIGGGMVVQQTYQIYHAKRGSIIDSRAWIAAFVATVIFEVCYHLIHRVAKQQHSVALKAEAIHYRIDGLTSLFAMGALLVGAYYPNWSVLSDHGGAILIAIVMIIVGWRAMMSNLHQLMDRVPEEDYFQRVQKAAMRVEGVHETEKVRIQLYGPDAHVDIDVEVDPSLAVEEAHRISQHVRAEIQKDWPAVQDVTVHIEPYYPGDH